jgi:hypothetical protein
MLVALGSIAANQATATELTLQECVDLLNYAATHPDAVIRFTASDMCLWIHGDASYLSESEARSRAGAFFFLSDNPSKVAANSMPAINGPIHVLSSIMKNVMASAAEAEVGASFMAAQDGCPIRVILEELGHPQPPTPLQTDNSIAQGIINGTVKQKRSKALDMRFYWLQDRVNQGQYTIYWRPGATNLGDYHTKHHSPAHHQSVRPLYLHTPASATARERFVRFCEDENNNIKQTTVNTGTANTAPTRPVPPAKGASNPETRLTPSSHCEGVLFEPVTQTSKSCALSTTTTCPAHVPVRASLNSALLCPPKSQNTVYSQYAGPATQAGLIHGLYVGSSSLIV